MKKIAEEQKVITQNLFEKIEKTMKKTTEDQKIIIEKHLEKIEETRIKNEYQNKEARSFRLWLKRLEEDATKQNATWNDEEGLQAIFGKKKEEISMEEIRLRIEKTERYAALQLVELWNTPFLLLWKFGIDVFQIRDDFAQRAYERLSMDELQEIFVEKYGEFLDRWDK